MHYYKGANMEKDIHVIKRQHFIPRKYLRGWASDERIWCSFNQTTPKKVNIENVGVGKYFYKFNSDIKSNELMYAKALFNDYPNPELYDFWTDLYMSFANLLNHMSNEDKKKKICNQLEEIINCEIEESFWTFLDQLRNGDSSFYNLYDNKVEFHIGLID